MVFFFEGLFFVTLLAFVEDFFFAEDAEDLEDLEGARLVSFFAFVVFFVVFFAVDECFASSRDEFEALEAFELCETNGLFFLPGLFRQKAFTFAPSDRV
ncbi:MAG: hypothetical protein AB8G23_02080 [Myxococcota bacterium]